MLPVYCQILLYRRKFVLAQLVKFTKMRKLSSLGLFQAQKDDV